MSSILETTRSLHEEVERQIESAVSELATSLGQRHPALQRDLILKERLQQISTSLSQLNAIYSDTDNLYKPHLISTLNLDPEGAFHEFDTTARGLIQRSTYKKNQIFNPDGSIIMVDGSNPTNSLNGLMYKQIINLEEIFSKEEIRGRCLDLAPFHLKFTSLLLTTLTSSYGDTHTIQSLSTAFYNSSTTKEEPQQLPQYLSSLSPIDITAKLTTIIQSLPTLNYSTFITCFDDNTFIIPHYIKSKASKYVLNEYYDYLLSLDSYLYSFLLRSNPLAENDGIKEDIIEEFVRLNSNNTVLGQQAQWDNVINHRQGKPYGIPLVEYPLWNLNGSVLPPPSPNISTDSSSLAAGDLPIVECKTCQRSFPGQDAYTIHLTTRGHITKFNKALKSNPMLAFYNSPTPPAATLADVAVTTKDDGPQPTPDQATDGKNTNGVKITPHYLATLQHKGQSDHQRDQLLVQISQIEFSIGVLADLLREVVSCTLNRSERRLTQTSAESTMDDIESSDDEETSAGRDQPDTSTSAANAAANLDNRLMTPDGRVIPPWLYKLHGLHMTYSCEICGGDIHRGERNFKRHFKEYKHTYMLRCLGVGSDGGEISDAYLDISKIQQVLDLHDHLKKRAATEGGVVSGRLNHLSGAVGEEFEDVLGNVTRRGAD